MPELSRINKSRNEMHTKLWMSKENSVMELIPGD